jgi:hypothetical protein
VGDTRRPLSDNNNKNNNMNTTEYIDNTTVTTLDPVNAALWLAHEWREGARKLITHLTELYAGKRGLLVTIEATRTMVQMPTVDTEGQNITITLRHWCSGYAGCEVEVEGLEPKFYAWVSNQWVNLN